MESMLIPIVFRGIERLAIVIAVILLLFLVIGFSSCA